MAMGTERSKNLHNFTMPTSLRWGNQRFLRCMKVNSNGQTSPLHRFDNDSDSDRRQRRSTREQERESSSEFVHGSRKMGSAFKAECFGGGSGGDGGRLSDDDGGGIAAIREKLMFDLQTAADKMKDAIFKEGLDDGKVSFSSPSPPPPPPALAGSNETVRPWNLRTRRAACKAPSTGFLSDGVKKGSNATARWSDGVGGGKSLRVDMPKPLPVHSPTRAAIVDNKSLTSGVTGTAGASPSGEKRERPKFSVALSRKEIEEDFMAMVNHRPPRRPKKRAKNIQKELNTLFPGLWLTDVTPDMYKVSEPAP